MQPIKYGIKFFFVCEAKTGYVLDCIIYRGVTSTLRDIVFNLLGRHLRYGYHIFMDNYYTSVALAEELYDNKTHVSGTLWLPRGAPKSLQNKAKSKSLARGGWHTAERTPPWLSFGRTYDWCRVLARGLTPAWKISPTDKE